MGEVEAAILIADQTGFLKTAVRIVGEQSKEELGIVAVGSVAEALAVLFDSSRSVQIKGVLMSPSMWDSQDPHLRSADLLDAAKSLGIRNIALMTALKPSQFSSLKVSAVLDKTEFLKEGEELQKLRDFLASITAQPSDKNG